MLDHMTFRVTDMGRAKAFYSAALAPLGYSVSFEGNYGMNILGFAYPDASEPDGKKADVWFIDGPSPYGGRQRRQAAISHGGQKLVRKSMPFISLRSTQEARTTEPRVFVQTITSITTAPL